MSKGGRLLNRNPPHFEIFAFAIPIYIEYILNGFIEPFPAIKDFN